MHGLQHTRSCYIRELIKFNFSDCVCLANVGGWKHGPVQKDLDWSGKTWEETESIATEYFHENIRELEGRPAEFEEAFNKNKVLYVFTFRNFYDSYVRRVRDVKPKYREIFLQHMLENWNIMNGHYLTCASDLYARSVIVTYEDLKTEKAKCSFINTLGHHFSLDKLNEQSNGYYDIKHRIDPRGKLSNRDSQFNEAPTHDTLHVITNEEMKYIQKNICPDVCQTLHYEVLDAANRP